MEITVKVRVNKERLEQLLNELKPRADSILDKSAFDIEMTAKSLALIDTGAMRASIYVSGGGRSGYGSAIDAAKKQGATNLGINSGRFNLNVEGATPPSVEELQRVIGCGVNYGIFVELRYKSFMARAAEQNRKSFISAWSALVG